MSIAALSKEQLLLIAREAVEKFQPQNYRMIVQDAHMGSFNGNWTVFVDVDREDVSGTDFAQRLVEIEDEVRRRTGQKVHVNPPMWRPD